MDADGLRALVREIRRHAMLRILAQSSVSGAKPLNARFVRKPMELDAPSIIELLAAEDLDEGRIVQALQQARAFGPVGVTGRAMSRTEPLTRRGSQGAAVPRELPIAEGRSGHVDRQEQAAGPGRSVDCDEVVLLVKALGVLVFGVDDDPQTADDLCCGDHP